MDGWYAAHEGDLAADCKAALLEPVTVQDGFVRRERDDLARTFYAEHGGKRGEGEAAFAQVDVEEVDAAIFDLGGVRGGCKLCFAAKRDSEFDVL